MATTNYDRVRTLIDRKLHKRFKVRCYENDTNMYNVLNMLVKQYLEDTDPKQ